MTPVRLLDNRSRGRLTVIRDHLPNRLDNDFRLVEMDPVTALSRDQVPAPLGRLRDGGMFGELFGSEIASGYDCNRNRSERLCFRRPGRGPRYSFQVATHALKRGGPAPMRLDGRPKLRRHLPYFADEPLNH